MQEFLIAARSDLQAAREVWLRSLARERRLSRLTVEAYERDTLLQALEEIGQDGGNLDFADLNFGGEPDLNDEAKPHESGEAEEIPEVDSPLDD